MELIKALTVLSFVTLFSLVVCSNDHHNHHEDNNWISIFPALEYLLRNKTTLSTNIPNEVENSIDTKDRYTEEVGIDYSTESSTVPILMDGDTGRTTSSSSGTYIGVPIGSIIIISLIVFCCYKCCCSRKVVVSGGTVIQQQAPNPTQIVIQQTQQAPTQPMMPYPPAYEQPRPQWNQYPPQQQGPMNPQFQQHPPPPPHYYPEGGGGGQYSPNYGKY